MSIEMNIVSPLVRTGFLVFYTCDKYTTFLILFYHQDHQEKYHREHHENSPRSLRSLRDKGSIHYSEKVLEKYFVFYLLLNCY